MENKTLRFIINRLRERSTWNGVLLLLGGTLWSLEPEQIEKIAMIGANVAGVLWMFFPDTAPEVENASESEDASHLGV